MPQSIARKLCPMTKVNSRLTNTLSDWPALRVSSGWISLRAASEQVDHCVASHRRRMVPHPVRIRRGMI